MIETLCKSSVRMTPGQNPFARMIILDYYDGPVSGVGECRKGCAFRFEMLVWDNESDIRVFSLAPLSEDCFQSLVTIFTRLEDPHWPVWAPNWGTTDQKANALKIQFEPILLAAEPVEWIVAWHDLEREGILASRRATAKDRKAIQNFDFVPQEASSRDWFEHMELPKRSR